VLHLKEFVCISLNLLPDLMTLSSAIEKGPQYKHVQCSLKKSDALRCLFFHRRHPTLNLQMMVDTRLSIVKAVVAAVQAYAKINATGAWIDRTETTSMNDLFERMSNQELDEYAKTGAMPEWFKVGVAE
jgi:hypothetical protein